MIKRKSPIRHKVRSHLRDVSDGQKTTIHQYIRGKGVKVPNIANPTIGLNHTYNETKAEYLAKKFDETGRLSESEGKELNIYAHEALVNGNTELFNKLTRYTASLDDRIAPLVITMNKNGFVTSGSCAGHDNEAIKGRGSSSTPDVVFESSPEKIEWLKNNIANSNITAIVLYRAF